MIDSILLKAFKNMLSANTVTFLFLFDPVRSYDEVINTSGYKKMTINTNCKEDIKIILSK